MPAVALTDTNGLYAAVQFYKLAQEARIKPIFGVALDIQWRVTSGEWREGIGEIPHCARNDRRKHSMSLVLLAADMEGYSNLCQLVTLRHLGTTQLSQNMNPAESDAHVRIAASGGAAENHHRRSVVQDGGRNAKTFSRSPRVTASNAGNRRPLQLATRTRKADLPRVYRSGRRNSGFLFGKSKSRGRAETLSLRNTRSAFAVDARVGSHQEVEPVAVFSARIGHRERGDR